MRLLDFMKERGLDDAGMAGLIGECTPLQVRKWKYRERTPRLPELIRIQNVTNSLVNPADFLNEVEAA